MIRGRMIAMCLVGALLLAGAVAGCGDAESTTSSGEEPKVIERSPSKDHGKRTGAKERVQASHCPGGHPSCRSAEGRIVYVERVDPDGDGDAHFVIRDPQGITLP